MSWTLGVANGDLDIDNYGNFVTVSGRDKCSQDLSEQLLSYYDESRDYGSRLHPGVVPPVGGRAFIAGELHSVVERLQNAQNDAANSDPYERVANVTQLDIITDTSDPTSFSYRLAVTTEAGDQAGSQSSVQYRQMRFGHLG